MGGCGSSSGPHTRRGGRLVVFAAASLAKVLPQIDPDALYTFAGSDGLETQIEQGAPADVFVAASPKQPATLYQRRLIDRPVPFATNTLVLVVPRSNPAHIRSVGDITRRGVKLVICQATVPCGDYARKAFSKLGITGAAMKNVASETADVTQTLAEVAVGQADAGFVYITDAEAVRGKVSVIGLPARARPRATDVIGVVRSGAHQAAARAFLQVLESPRGQNILHAAGFGRP